MRLKKDYSRVWTVIAASLLFVASFLIGMRMMPVVVGANEAEGAGGSGAAVETGKFFVTVFDEDEKIIVKTSAATVADLLGRMGVEVAEYDKVEPALESRLSEDVLTVSVSRARPVLLKDGGVARYVMSTAWEPQAMFAEVGITLNEDDEVTSEMGGFVPEVGLVKEVYKVTRSEVEAEESEEAPAPEPERPQIKPEWATCTSWAREAGVDEDDLYAALTLIYRESNCRVAARNARSGAYGIPQALPGSKMANAGEDWETNPVTQIRWMAGYVRGRYGGWQQALDFWNVKHWY